MGERRNLYYDVSLSSEEDGALLLYPTGSGITWVSRSGGSACSIVSREGILLPLPHAQVVNDTMILLHPSILQHRSFSGCQYYRCDPHSSVPSESDELWRLQRTMFYQNISRALQRVPVPLEAIEHEDNQEAWLCVRILENGDPVMKHFIGQVAILIWCNCG